MKIRKHGSASEDKIELQMTPMIDIVFQLLIFFIMSFKIAAVEGDFQIKMPLAATSSQTPEDIVTPATVVLQGNGEIQSVFFNSQNVPLASKTIKKDDKDISIRAVDVDRLRDYGKQWLDGKSGADLEVEIDASYNLDYGHVIEAITALSGEPTGEEGQVVKLFENIKFSPPKVAPGGAGD